MENNIKTKSDFFYTDVQINILKHSILRGDNIKEAAARYAAQFHKPQQGVYCKMLALKRKSKVELTKVITDITTKEAKIVVEQGINLPEGFLFEGIPSKVMICKDHFRIYF